MEFWKTITVFQVEEKDKFYCSAGASEITANLGIPPLADCQLELRRMKYMSPLWSLAVFAVTGIGQLFNYFKKNSTQPLPGLPRFLQ